MAKVYLVSKTQPDFPKFLAFCKEALGRSVSNLSDTKSRPIELQRFALMLSEAIDPDADYSVLDNLGPVLGHISFSFSTIIHDTDFKDLSTILRCEIIRIDSKVNGFSVILMHANLKCWREAIIDSLSSNITNTVVHQIITSIYDIIRAEGFNRLWSDIDIERDSQGILIRK